MNRTQPVISSCVSSFSLSEDRLVEMQDDRHHFLTRPKETLIDLVLGVAQLDRVNGKSTSAPHSDGHTRQILDTEPGVAIVRRQQDRAAMPVALHSEENPGERLSPVVRNAIRPSDRAFERPRYPLLLERDKHGFDLGLKDRLNRPRLSRTSLNPNARRPCRSAPSSA